jgi:hypothetical protein
MSISAWLHEKLRRCSWCHFRRAVWWYGPGEDLACDKCVPRGCSCNEEPVDGNPDNEDPSNWVEVVDPQGRKYPCCEWMQFTTTKPRDKQ